MHGAGPLAKLENLQDVCARCYGNNSSHQLQSAAKCHVPDFGTTLSAAPAETRLNQERDAWSNWPKEEKKHSEGVDPPVQHSEGLDPPVQAEQWGSLDPPAHAWQWRHGPTCLGLPQSGEQPPLWTRRLESYSLVVACKSAPSLL